MAIAIAGIVFGALELFFGRRLFWLFVAIAGFLVGYFLAPAIFGSMGTTLRVIVGIGIGIAFALLAVFFTRLMVAVAGFFALGSGAVLLVRDVGLAAPQGSAYYWIAYAVGGVVGFVLLWVFFDWALVVLTGLAGAGAIVQGLRELTSLSPTWQIVIFAALAALGITFQAWSYQRHRLAHGPMATRRR